MTNVIEGRFGSKASGAPVEGVMDVTDFLNFCKEYPDNVVRMETVGEMVEALSVHMLAAERQILVYQNQLKAQAKGIKRLNSKINRLKGASCAE